LSDIVPLLPHVNASLNALATVLLVVGYVLIKWRQEAAHKWTMLACFAVSVAFLACYLTYHYHLAGVSKPFPSYPPPAVRAAYYTILITHVILAAAVPFLALATIYTGLADKRRAHLKLAWWTFPIWLYVSVTGVIVYLMLYQIYLPVAQRPTITESTLDARP
jgi:putative membrane protein